MTCDMRGQRAPDYQPVRYGASRLVFRGPLRGLNGDHIVILGGSETYGKFIEAPYPDLVEAALGVQVVNFGCLNAGVDAFAFDQSVLDVANAARAVVVQIMGAQNMSNRLYTVHPRRNDRFLNASSLLKAVYREVDFTEFHFTGHMLGALQKIDAARFDMVRDELKRAWIARMRGLMKSIDRPVLLLWFSDHAAPEPGDPDLESPMFVDTEMLDAVAPASAGLIQVVASAEAMQEGVARMAFDDLDHAAAQEQLSVLAHEEVSDRLTPALGSVLNLA